MRSWSTSSTAVGRTCWYLKGWQNPEVSFFFSDKVSSPPPLQLALSGVCDLLPLWPKPPDFPFSLAKPKFVIHFQLYGHVHKFVYKKGHHHIYSIFLDLDSKQGSRVIFLWKHCLCSHVIPYTGIFGKLWVQTSSEIHKKSRKGKICTSRSLMLWKMHYFSSKTCKNFLCNYIGNHSCLFPMKYGQ